MTGNGGILHLILCWHNLLTKKGETPALAPRPEAQGYRTGGELGELGNAEP